MKYNVVLYDLMPGIARITEHIADDEQTANAIATGVELANSFYHPNDSARIRTTILTIDD